MINTCVSKRVDGVRAVAVDRLTRDFISIDGSLFPCIIDCI